MTQFRIHSTASVDYGIWPGTTPEEAFAAMVASTGGTVGDPQVGTADDWIIEPAGQWVVEGKGSAGDWSRDYVEAGGDAIFVTEKDALSALDALARLDGWKRDELRVREL